MCEASPSGKASAPSLSGGGRHRSPRRAPGRAGAASGADGWSGQTDTRASRLPPRRTPANGSTNDVPSPAKTLKAAPATVSVNPLSLHTTATDGQPVRASRHREPTSEPSVERGSCQTHKSPEADLDALSGSQPLWVDT